MSWTPHPACLAFMCGFQGGSGAWVHTMYCKPLDMYCVAPVVACIPPSASVIHLLCANAYSFNYPLSDSYLNTKVRFVGTRPVNVPVEHHPCPTDYRRNNSGFAFGAPKGLPSPFLCSPAVCVCIELHHGCAMQLMASVAHNRKSCKDTPVHSALGAGGATKEPAGPTDATLAFTTHTEYLTPDNVRHMLPKILQQIVSPSADTQTAASHAREAARGAPTSIPAMLAAAHFAADAQLSHPLGYAVGVNQIACLLTMLQRIRSLMFPEVEVIVLRSMFDEQHESAALEVKAVMRMRWLGIKVPVLAEIFCELVDRRDGHPGLCITYWSEHYSMRTWAAMLPGSLARWVDWCARRAVAVVAEKVVGHVQR